MENIKLVAENVKELWLLRNAVTWMWTKLHSTPCHEAVWSEAVQVQMFLITAVDSGESSSGRSIPGDVWIRGWMVFRANLNLIGKGNIRNRTPITLHADCMWDWVVLAATAVA
jgi:hypothetical protein